MSLKLINIRQTTLSLGLGQAESIRVIPPGPGPSAAPFCQHPQFTAALTNLSNLGGEGATEKERKMGRCLLGQISFPLC